MQYFNPLPPCGGRPDPCQSNRRQLCISIHSLRVEGDKILRRMYATAPISIHSLRVEGDFSDLPKSGLRSYFNPLPPCGGRLSRNQSLRNPNNFNPLPPCGGRPINSINYVLCRIISIHSLRVEGDDTVLLHFRPLSISIHSLRVEGD